MKKSNPIIVVGAIMLIILILLLSGGLLVRNYIKNEISEIQAGPYRIQSREVSVNLFLRQIKLTDVVAEDSVTGQKISVPELKASGIHIFSLLFNDETVINKLQFHRPEVLLIKKGPDAKDNDKNDSAGKQEAELDFIRIKKLEINKAAVSLMDATTGESDTLFSLHAGLEVWNLNINSERQHLTFSKHSAEKLEAKVNNGRYNLPGGLYRLQFETLEFSSMQNALNLENLHFSSLYPKYEIAKQTGVETDWYDITLKHFELQGINMQVLLKDTAFVFRRAVLEELDAKIFRDKRPPFPDKPDSKLPVQMLESLPVAVHSDSILIKNSNIVYEEHSEGSTDPGKLSFNQLYASIFNLGTIADSINGQTAMTVRAMVMNEALLKTEFVFPNNEYSYQYKASGTLEPVSIGVFNPMLVPSGGVKVNEGRINRFEFEFNYNNDRSEGNLILDYENLDITIQDKEDGSKKTIKTFITETFVLNKDNQKENNSYRKGNISFERDKKKSIFNYWWQSLFSGIKVVLAF